MTLTWQGGDETQYLRACRLAGIPFGHESEVSIGTVLARLCDLVEQRLPPELPDAIEIHPAAPVRDLNSSPYGFAATAEQVPYYEVRVRLGGIGYYFQAVRPEPTTERRFAAAMAVLGDRPTLRQALTRARDVLAHEANHGPATDEATLRLRREALDLADRALETP